MIFLLFCCSILESCCVEHADKLRASSIFQTLVCERHQIEFSLFFLFFFFTFHYFPTSGETVEGNTVNVSLIIQRDHGTFKEVTVPWKLSPATDEDLRPSSGTMVFPPGQDSYTLTLQTVDDDVSVEDDTKFMFVCSVSTFVVLKTLANCR